jgi:hypothetical protein
MFRYGRLLEEPPLATILQGVYFVFYIFLPLYVSAHAGHLQVEYTIMLGSYFTHNGSVVLCYRSRLLCMLANTAVFFLICVCELSKLGQITSLLNVKTINC